MTRSRFAAMDGTSDRCCYSALSPTRVSVELGIASGNEPGARGRPYTVIPRVSRQRFSEGHDDLMFAPFAFLSGEANDLPGWAERHGKLDRFRHVLAYADVGVETLEANAVVAGAAQQQADHVRACHRKGPGPTMHLVRVLV